MKKLLAVFAAVVMMSACTKKEEAPAEAPATEAAPTEAAPAEGTTAPTDAAPPAGADSSAPAK